MVRSGYSWARTFVRRGLVAAIMVLALAIYGLVSAGTHSLAFKPTASTSSSGGSQFAVSMAVSPTNKSVNVAAMGPNNTLMFWWNVVGTWYGPLGIGAAGSTFSAPDIVAQSNGNFDIAVEGPGNALYLYWDVAGKWYGPLGAGPAGSTFSTPSMGIETQGAHNIDVAAEGPGNTLNTFWEDAPTAHWYGPGAIDGPNSTYSAPSLLTTNSGTNNILDVTNQGRNNSLRAHEFTQGSGVGWVSLDASNDGTTFSAPAGFSASPDTAVFEGTNHALYEAINFSQLQLTQLAGGGNVYSAPAIQPSGVGSYIAAEGPANTLYLWLGANGGTSVLQLGAPGSTFSAPAMTLETPGSPTTSTVDFVAEGPGNSLYFYWDIGPGKFYGPVTITGSAGMVVTSGN